MDYTFGGDFDGVVEQFSDSDSSSAELNVSVVEVFDLKEKRKWMELFRKNYSGGLMQLNPMMFSEKYCRFFVAIVEGKQVGFIRITNKTDAYKDFYEDEVWCASDAYIKKPYRGNGVLRRLIQEVVSKHKVKVARLETERLERCLYYYTSLGFIYGWQVQDSDLSIIVQEELIEPSIKWQVSVRKS
jgi:GNAT superfamily N-acetyltransferase